MASTTQEAEIIERRLRPVYDAIDNGQNKKVIQLVEKILKKSPTLHCAKALKAIALLRLGRTEEGDKLVNNVIQLHPGDSATLQAIFMYCRELGDYKKMVELYEAAVKSYPSNEEILTQLFMAYVRVGDYQKQQQAALQLLKHYPHNGPYYCWRVMSILMQAHEAADERMVQSMYLPLAEKLMDKYVSDKRVDAEAEVRLYITVLQCLNNREKILSVLSGELREKLRNPDEVLMIELTCMKSLKQWDKITIKVAALLPDQPDHWSYIKLYIAAQINRAVAIRDSEKCDGEGENASASWLSPVYEMKHVLDHLLDKEKEKSSHRFRGPYLAQLEVLDQMTHNKITIQDDRFSNPPTLLEEYFKIFSSKTCCYDDIKCYLTLLSKEEQLTLLQTLEAWSKKDPVNFTCEEDEISQNITKLHRDITLVKLQRHCGCHGNLTIDTKRFLVQECCKKFEDGLHFGLSLPATVNQYSDFYVILAAHLMIEICQETADPADLWRCIIMLETARKQSHTNPQIQLLLIKLYGYLGAVDFCTQLYNSLSIKHIQTDTIGYISNRYIQSMGAFEFASQMYRIALRFYVGCNKETSDYITNAYKNGVFHKIIEMIKLRDRICRSHSFYSLGVESMLLEFLNDVNSMDQAREFFLGEKFKTSLPFTVEDLQVLCDGLRDNRDLDIFEEWSPPDQRLTDEEILLSFQLECQWIKLRLLIMQSLKEVLAHVTTPTKESSISKLKMLELLLNEVKDHNGIKFLFNKKCTLLPIQCPPPSQLSLLLSEGHGTLLCHVIHIVLSVLEQTDSAPSSLSDNITAAKVTLKGIVDNIHGIPEDAFTTPDDLDNNPYRLLLETKIDLEPYVMLIIVSSWIIVLCGTCIEHLSRHRQGKKKKKSKMPAEGAAPSLNVTAITMLAEFLVFIKSSLLTLATQFKTIPTDEESILVDKLSKLYIGDKITDNGVPMEKEAVARVKAEVCTGVIESYNMSFRGCRDIIGVKTSFITTLLESCPTSDNVPSSERDGASLEDRTTMTGTEESQITT